MLRLLLSILLAGFSGYVLHWAKSEDEREQAEPTDPALPLNRVWLCVQCEWISGASVRCPQCGSQAMVSVSRLIFAERSRKV